MVRFLERLCHLFEVVAGILLGAVTILIVVSSVGRYLLAKPVPDSFDISRMLIGACIMWGFASVGYRGGHIKVDLFVELMPARVKRYVDVFAWSMLLLFTVLLTWKMLGRVVSAMHSNEATFDLRLQVWPMIALIWAGTAVTVLTVLVRLYLIIIGRDELESSEASEMGDLTDGGR